MPGTYESIASQTLGSAAASITFSSIPATFTDLRLVVVVNGLSVANEVPYLQFNADSASNYSGRVLYGTGGIAYSLSQQTRSILSLAANGIALTIPTLITIDIMQYKNTGLFKTTLAVTANDRNGAGYIDNWVNLWRSTAAINSIKLGVTGATNFNTGTTAELIGISNA